ncbi:hypothetical protein LXL04_011950 [Taraxacum kok-saghyz]
MPPKSKQKQVKFGNFFKRKVDVGTNDENSGGKRQHQPHTIPKQPQPQPIPQQPQPQGPQPSEPTTFGVHNLPYDPADRPKITTYGANEVEEIRREYWVKGHRQPRGHLFPKTIQFGKNRRFVKEWFDDA